MDYFFFFFLAAFFVAIEFLLGDINLGPISIPASAFESAKPYHFMILRDAICIVNGKMRARSYHEHEVVIVKQNAGTARTIGYAIGIAAAIVVMLWRLAPHVH